MKLHINKRHLSIVAVVVLIIVAGASFLFFLKTNDKVRNALNMKSADELIKEATEAEKAGDKALAITRYEEAVKKSPENADIKSDLAVLYYQDKQYDKASSSWQEVIKEKQGDSFASNMAGNSYRDSGNIDEAIKCYKSAIENGNMDSVANLVTLYNSSGRFDESITLLNQLIEKYPDDATLKQLLASTKSKSANK